jgi:Fur family transcriptional regulator, ferric uptake regulator
MGRSQKPSSSDRASLGQRQTLQRDAILEVITSAAGPLTVPEILERSQERVPGLGIATVYRTVKLLLDTSRVQTVILPSGETRYESSGLGHHHHFHCRSCDEVFDLATCPVQVPRGTYEGGYRVEDHELTLYGTCPGCS